MNAPEKRQFHLSSFVRSIGRWLLVTGFCCFGSQIVTAQQSKPLKEIIHQIEEQYRVVFAYDEEAVAHAKAVMPSLADAKLAEVLDQILVPNKLEYELLDNRFVLIRKASLTVEKEAKRPLPNICGRIISSRTQEALPYATVGFLNTDHGVYADANGNFELYTAASRDDSLIIRHLGYEELHLSVASVIDQPCRDILVNPAQFTIDNVIIEERAIRLLRSASKGSGWQIKPDKMSTLPGWGDNDPLRMVQLLPGIHSTDESASNLHIRGGTPDQNLVLWDNIPIYHTGHFFGLFSAFDPFAAETIDVYKGGYGPKFGGRVSGVIDIKSKPSRIDSLEMGFGANLINVQGYLKAPLDKGKSALWVSGRRSFTDIVQSGTYQNLFNQIASRGRIRDNEQTFNQEDLEILLSPEFYFSDLNIKWVMRPAEDQQLDLSFHWGNDFLDYQVFLDQFGYYLDSRDLIELNSGGASISWRQAFGDEFDFGLNLVYSRIDKKYDLDATWRANEVFGYLRSQRNDLEELEMQALGNWRPNQNHHLSFGLESHRLNLGFNLGVEDRVEMQRHRSGGRLEGTLHNLLIDYSYSIKEEVALNYGLRVGHYDHFDFWFWEPRFSIDYHMSKPLKLRMAASRNLQFVSQIVELNDLGLEEELWILASEQVGTPPMVATEYSLGLNYEKNNWFVNLEGYKKRINNITTVKLRSDTNDNLPTTLGGSEIEGVDLLFKRKWKVYETWFSYAYGHVDYSFPDLEEDGYFPASHDQRHTVNWTHFLKVGSWDFSLSWNFHTGRPFTPAAGVDVNVDEQGEELGKRIVLGRRNSERLPDYRRMDLSVTYNFIRDRYRWKMGLSIFNVFNQENIFDRKFIPFEEHRPESKGYFGLDRTMIGRTPNIFFRVDW